MRDYFDCSKGLSVYPKVKKIKGNVDFFMICV